MEETTLITVIFIVIFAVHSIWAIVLINREKNAQKIIGKAEKRARDILEAAQEKAAKSLTEATYLKESLQQTIKDSVEAASQSITAGGKDSAEKLAEAYLLASKQAAAKLEQQALTAFSEVSDEIRKESGAVRVELNQIIKLEHEKLLIELAEYKSQKKLDFEQELQKKTELIIKELLPYQITISDQEKLIVTALHKAQADGLFT